MEDFLFLSLYLFSYIAINSMTLETVQPLVFVLVSQYALRVQSCNIHIACTRPTPVTGQCGNSYPQSNYRPAFLAQLLSATSYLCPKNERQRRVKDFKPCIIVNQRTVRRHLAIIELSAAILSKIAVNAIVICPKISVNGASTERQ
jgi:hypothetical protein